MQKRLDFKNNDTILYYIAVFCFSFISLSLETVAFHVLLVVTGYLKATFIISIAMLGIATGSFLSFYLSKFHTKTLLLFASFLLFISILLSYYNIIHIGTLKYPFFLIIPFIICSCVISLVFSKANSNKTYFTNLVASALGVLSPIFLVAAFKSENSFFIIGLIPLFFMLLLSLKMSNKTTRIAVQVGSSILILLVFIFLYGNMRIINKIDAKTFEAKIMPKLGEEYEKPFMERVFKQNTSGTHYDLTGDKYDKKRSKYLLNKIGFQKTVDLNFNIPYHEDLRNMLKIYGVDNRVILSEDNLLGRIELLGDDDYMLLAVDGVVLDGIDSYNGVYYDPRVPHIKNANAFIVGLSADGIVKSVKRLNPAKTSGIEINPIIREIMEEDTQFSRFAYYPYKDVNVYFGEGRSFLESTDEIYDMITLMNIHAEHGPICTLSPEYFHTVEATKILLNKTTPRGYVVYEEIVMNDRSEYAFLKFLNTIKQAMRELGVENPAKNIVVFGWDFWSSNNVFLTVAIKKEAFTNEEISEFDKYLAGLRTHWEYDVNTLIYPNTITNSEYEKFLNTENNNEQIGMPKFFSGDIFENDVLTKVASEDEKTLINEVYYKGTTSGNYYLKNNIDDDQIKKAEKILLKTKHASVLDLKPCTDDKPFPFNVYKDKKEVKDLLFIVLVLCLIIFIPVFLLLFLKYKDFSSSLFKQLGYFSILGFSFMLVEIVLMQKYQQFIGNPTYSLILVLGGLMLFSGFGSFFTRKLPRKVIIILMCCIPLILLIKLFFLDSIFLAFAKYSFVSKLFITTALLFPITFLMGIPFPHALELVKKNKSQEYATLMYGVSGAFSTIASTASILISVTFGFSVSFTVGLLGYIGAIFLFSTFKE